MLPPGQHRATIDEFRGAFVQPYPIGSRRLLLFNHWLQWITPLGGKGLVLEQWVDGSFVESKPDPKDIDVVTLLDGIRFDAMPLTDQQFVLNYLTASGKAAMCDAYWFPVYPPGHPKRGHTDWGIAYWNRQWGHNRQQQPKGYLVIS